MSRSFKSTSSRPLSQSAALTQAQQIATQQMAALGLSGTSVGGAGTGAVGGGYNARASPMASTLARTRPASATTSALRGNSLTRTGPRRPAPRGSAAPAGTSGVDIDLAAFTGGLSGTLDAAGAAPAEAPALENEYIVNLQQQVYFLELELNLLKKAGGGGGSMNPAGLRGSGAPGSGGAGGGGGGGVMNDANVPDAPLDDVMLSLREKYVRMEAEFKKEVQDLKNDNAELRSRARMRELEIGNLKQLHGNLSNETQNWKATAQDHQSTLLDHQLANEQMILKLTTRLAKREKKLEKALDDLINLKAEHKVAQENYTSEREAYTEKWNDRERRMDELNEAFLSEKERNLEWQERFRQSNEQKLMHEVQALEQARLAMESAVKKSELSKEQAEKNQRAALESLDRVMEENEALRSAVQSMEHEKKLAQEKEDRDRKSKTFWSAEVANLQSQLQAVTDKWTKLQAKYADAKAVKKQLKDELIQSRVYLEELTARFNDEQDQHNRTRAQEEDLNELTREMKRDLTIKTEELNTLIGKYKEVKALADTTQQERDSLHVQLTELQAKFDVHEALQGLKLHEFVSMAHSNLKVAGAIENLMGRMKKGEQDVRKEKRELRAKTRDQEDDLYSDTATSARTASSATPRSRRLDTGASDDTDSRPTTQQSDLTQESDSRPATSSTMESSFDGI